MRIKGLISIVIISVLLYIRWQRSKLNGMKTLSSKDIMIGVVETTSTNYNSMIHWYDKELNKISDQKLKYAMLGSPFHNPVYYDDEIFMIPQGLGNKKDSKKVISIDANDLKIKEYPFNNIALNDLAVIRDYIYTINTLNGSTYINRLDKNNHTLEEIILEDEYISGIVGVKEEIYAFSSNMSISTPKFYLYIYNLELELLDKKDITQYGTGQYKFMLHGNYLYVGVMYTKEDRPSSILLKIDIETNDVKGIDIKESFPNDILNHKDKVIITNHNLVINEGCNLTVLDPNTLKLKSIQLDEKTEFAKIIDEQLIIANQGNICQYDIENGFKLMYKRPIEKREDSYISSMIILPS